MNYTEEQIKEWKTKAEKWDSLYDKISEYYVDEDDNIVEDDKHDGGLLDIGEIAARAFGFL